MNRSQKIQQIVSAYQEYIKLNYSEQHHKSFSDFLKKNNEEAAISEAIVFNWLCQNDLSPKIHEDKSIGGADFICKFEPNYNFIVEVTCLGSEELTKATGCTLVSGQSMFYDLPTKMVWRRVSQKATQLSVDNMPRILVIASLHKGAYFLLGSEEAEAFLLSDWSFTFPIGGFSENISLSTNLAKSMFFRFKKEDHQKIEFCRESISAVLFMAIADDFLTVTGVLHPKPTYSLNTKIFPNVSFIKIKNDMIQERKIITEWTNPNSQPIEFSLDESINEKI